MPVNYKSLLMTTCASVFAFSVATLNPAQAGFEWTPPEEEKVEIAPQMMEPSGPISNAQEMNINNIPDMGEEDIIEELSPEQNEIDDMLEAETQIVAEELELDTMTSNDTLNAPIEIKVLEDSTELPDTDLTEVEHKNDIQDHSEQLFDLEPIEKTGKADTAEKVIMVPEDEQVSVIEANEEAPQDAGLTIDLFPLEGEQDTAPKSDIIVLTDDAITVTSEASEMQDTTTDSPNERYDVIEGFGSDIPLALVLRQIVPAQYAFAFGNGVNPGAIMSWEGGEPWNIVLENTLSPAGYGFAISGNKVIIRTRNVNDMPKASPAVSAKGPADVNTVSNDSATVETAPLTNVVEPQDEPPAPAPVNKRGAIMDPGQTESSQPEVEILSDEKKKSRE